MLDIILIYSWMLLYLSHTSVKTTTVGLDQVTVTAITCPGQLRLSVPWTAN